MVAQTKEQRQRWREYHTAVWLIVSEGTVGCVTTGAPVAGVTKFKLAKGVPDVAAVVEIKFGAESASTEA
jgi:hypothetical protein